MANPEHLRILNQGPRVWNDWRSKNDGIFPDLSEAKLEGAKLCKEYIFPDVLNPGMAFGYTEGINLISTKLSGADLRGADLREANLTSADLSYADLSNADLSSSYNCRTDYCEANLASARFTGASLNNANLSAANLEDADIENAGLWNTELKGANLMKAWLGWATISNAQLTAVNLRDAELNFTTFEKVELNGADIHGANFFETAFINCDLSKVKNIEACNHKGPSYVDHTTLSKSRGLPEIFLRGCGLSNWEIDISKLYSNNLTPAEVTDIVYRISESHSRAPIQFYSCFISYSHADKHFAQILYDSLQNRGIRCWFDEHQILPGDDIRDQLDRGVNLWDKILLCCSVSSLNSYWVNHEIDKALNKEERLWIERGNKVLALIPLNLDDYIFKWSNSRASVLKNRHAEHLVGWDKEPLKLERALQRIEMALRTDHSGRQRPPTARL